MIEWFLSLFREEYKEREKRQRESRSDFVIEAVGSASCLLPDEHVPGSLAFETIDQRIKSQQQLEPARAHHCGIPDLGDPNRKEQVKDILRDMTHDGKARRSQGQDRWELVKDTDKI